MSRAPWHTLCTSQAGWNKCNLDSTNLNSSNPGTIVSSHADPFQYGLGHTAGCHGSMVVCGRSIAHAMPSLGAGPPALHVQMHVMLGLSWAEVVVKLNPIMPVPLAFLML